MKGFRAFFKRMSAGHRPPSGPLTTAEAIDAEELRQEQLTQEPQRGERKEAEAGRDPDSGSE